MKAYKFFDSISRFFNWKYALIAHAIFFTALLLYFPDLRTRGIVTNILTIIGGIFTMIFGLMLGHLYHEAAFMNKVLQVMLPRLKKALLVGIAFLLLLLWAEDYEQGGISIFIVFCVNCTYITLWIVTALFVFKKTERILYPYKKITS
jgi:hypothetical protein